MRTLGAAFLAAALLPAPLAAQTLFGPPALQPLDSVVVAAIAADVDADGVADLVARDAGGHTLVRLGTGAGAFAEPAPLPWAGFGSSAPVPLALGDLNGDGDADLVVDALQDDALLVFRGDGAGGFDGSSSPAFLAAGGGARRALLLDLDADGAREMLMLSEGFDGASPVPGTLQAYAFDGEFAWQFLFAVTGDAVQGALRDVALGDVDGDGVRDLILADTSFDGASTRVLVMTGIGGLAFKPPVLADVVPGLADLRAFDFDHDGALDLLGLRAAGSPGVQLLSGDGAGGFTPSAFTPLPSGVVALRDADFDADGVVDLLAVLDASLKPPPAPSALVLRGLDDGSFGDAHPLAPLPGADFAPLALVADVDPDGRPDVLLASRVPLASGPALAVLRNETYPGDGPLLDLGGALPGSLGAPIQLASGSFEAGSFFAFTLAQVQPGGDAFLVTGFSELGAAFKGGVMLPSVDRVFGPLPVLASGEAGLAGFWPAGVPAGFELFTQFWVPDAVGVAGFASSSAVRVSAP